MKYSRLGAFVGAWVLTGCIIDEQRCDAHQVELSGDFALCVCEPNAAFNASGAGCTPCGENEVAPNGACVCKEGFAKLSADAGCVASSAGAACSASAPCSAEFPFCVPTENYCSKQGCATNADCPSNFTCETGSAGKYCRRPPTGLGTPCNTSAECASFEANYCEALSTHTCILGGCATGMSTCPNEWLCCDYSALLGSPLSTCASPAQQSNGACPLGGTRVNP